MNTTGHLNIHYGGSPRERLDLFLAANPKAPILAFIHGGYWQMYNGIGIAPEIREVVPAVCATTPTAKAPA